MWSDLIGSHLILSSCPLCCTFLCCIFIKVKMQTFPTLHTNLFKCSRLTFVQEGFRGFYSGTLPGTLHSALHSICGCIIVWKYLLHLLFSFSSRCNCCWKLLAVHGLRRNSEAGVPDGQGWGGRAWCTWPRHCRWYHLPHKGSRCQTGWELCFYCKFPYVEAICDCEMVKHRANVSKNLQYFNQK